jgi:hypothetical protein
MFLLASLAGMAAGVFPEKLLPARAVGSPPPVLAAMLALQAGWIILFFPLTCWRLARAGVGWGLLAGVAEFLLWLLPCLPLYLVSIWLGNAHFSQLAGGLVYLACLASLGIALGQWLALADSPGGRWRWVLTAVILVCVLLALGWPAVAYFGVELGLADLPAGPAVTAFEIGAGHTAAPAAHGPWPNLWSCLPWPLAAAALILARLALPKPVM